MDINGFHSNQPINQQPLQYPLPVNKTKNTNTMLIVVAGLATGLGGILGLIVSSVISVLFLNNPYSNSITLNYLISYLLETILFIITAVIIIIAGVIACKKSVDRLKFFACCLSGKVIGTFFKTIIFTIIFAFFYITDIDIPLSFSFITTIVDVFSIIVSAVAAALLLYFMLSKEKTVAPINNNLSTQKYNTVNF